MQEKNQTLQEADRIVITESPIDALSYRQMELNGQSGWKTTKQEVPDEAKQVEVGHTAFISTCGNLTMAIKRDLEQVFQLAQQNNQVVILALDADVAGRKMTETLSHMLEEARCSYGIEVPSRGKDWNDVLKTGPMLELARETTKETAQTQWEVFEASSYETSLLKQVGLEETTLKAFGETIQVNEQALLVALREEQTPREIAATWALQLDPHQGLKEHVDLAVAPALSILKGDVQQAQQLVLVPSPLDALLHYQKETEAIKKLQENVDTLNKNLSDINQENKHTLESAIEKPTQAYQSAIDQRLAKLERTCYVYADPRSQQDLEVPLSKLIQDIHADKRSWMVASSQVNEPLMGIIEQCLQNQEQPYTRQTVEISSTSQTATMYLGPGMSLLAALSSANGSLEEEDEEEIEKKQPSMKSSL